MALRNLKRAEVTNHEKEIEFKINHNLPLLPKGNYASRG